MELVFARSRPLPWKRFRVFSAGGKVRGMGDRSRGYEGDAAHDAARACVLREVQDIIAIGDLHGNYAGLWAILTELEIIDAQGHWCGGNTHVVQMGDVLGRGGEPGKIFALFMRLELEAEAAGGGFHMLLGNHEVMSIRGTLVYNTPAEFQDIAEIGPTAFGLLPEGMEQSEKRNECVTPDKNWTAVAASAASNPQGANPQDPAPQGTLSPQEKYRRRLAMLGCEAFQRYLHPSGPIGAWLLRHPTAMVLGDSLFVHGGLAREHGLMDLAALNIEVSEEIEAAAQGYEWGHRLVKNGPQWNRELALKASPHREAELDDVLAFHGCARMVVGHTPTGSIKPLRTGEVLPLYDERLWCVDTGIGTAYGGHLSALKLQAGEVSAAYPSYPQSQ